MKADSDAAWKQHAEMMKPYVGLCVLAGLDIRGRDPLEVFILAGAVIADPLLTERAARLARTERPDCIVPEGARERVLRAMPEHERRLLRERVLDVRPIRQAPSQHSG